MRIFIAVLLLLGYSSTYGQNMQRVEQELLAAFKKIDYWYQQKDLDPDLRTDSLRAANVHFSDLLCGFGAKLPGTMRSDFSTLIEQGLIIAASVDGLFRIYSWNTQEGGTAASFENVYQYKVGNKLVTEKGVKADGHMGRFYSSIYMLKNEEKVYYIGLFHGKGGTVDLSQGVKLFALENKALDKKVALFRTQSGMQNEIIFGFDMSTALDRSDNNYKLIYYDEADKKLHIPVVLDNGKVTRRFIVYAFNGEYFERLKD